MDKVNCASWRRFNANSRGKDTGDCVKRAISTAFDISYSDVSKRLVAKQKELSARDWRYSQVFSEVIKDLGGSSYIEPESLTTVEEFIDSMDTNGVYIIECTKHPAHYGKGSHLTVSIHGDLVDSWNCLDWFVCSYYVVSGLSHQFTNINDELDELREEGLDYLFELSEKLSEKYNLDPQGLVCMETRIVSQDYRIIYPIRYQDVYYTKDYKLAVVFSPTTDIDSAKDKLFSTIKQRMETFYYNLSVEVKKLKSGFDLFYESGYSLEDRSSLRLYPQEARFYKGLPKEIVPFIEYISVVNPGQYVDSYSLRIKPIKGDPDFDRNSSIDFEGYTAADIQEQVRRYLKNRELPGRDYDVYEEIYY